MKTEKSAKLASKIKMIHAKQSKKNKATVNALAYSSPSPFSL